MSAKPSSLSSSLSPPTSAAGAPAMRRVVSLERARKLAKLTDQRFLDPLLGLLVPGAGDLLSGAIGLYIVAVAIQAGIPKATIARMIINLSVDTLIGAVPLVGDLFDVAFRANRRNLTLIEQRPAGGRARASDWVWIAGAAVLLLAAIAVPVLIVVFLLAKL